MTTFPWRPILRAVERLIRDQARSTRTQAGTRPRTAASPARTSQASPRDFDGCPDMAFGTQGPGGHASGEIVWTWVPYEEDHTQGKDRPVLLIGSDASWLLGLPCTSKDHDRDEEQERRAGRYWVDIGTGPWDAKRRPSEVRTDRIVRVAPADIRRTAGSVTQRVFGTVTEQVRVHWDD